MLASKKMLTSPKSSSPSMFPFLRLFRSGTQSAFKTGNRSHQTWEENGYTVDTRRKSALAKHCRRATIAQLLIVLSILLIMYITTWDRVSHHGTALRCKWAVSRTSFPDTLTPSYANNTEESHWARIVQPNELMQRLENGERMDTKILHQSWKEEHLPERFAIWSEQWRRLHGRDWTYVLWTDADNLQLVQKYYPQFLQTYQDLPKEVYRADMVRNMYMHRFGGVYADLDLIPLQAISQHLPILAGSTPPPIHLAYVGHMSDDEFEHSIPNAFLASTPPGHPFWLKPMEFIRDHRGSATKPETLTGPVALRRCVKAWEADRDVRHGEGVFDEVVVLENGKIYPFSWWDSPFRDQCICRPQSDHFNSSWCNSLYPRAWTITYWSHSWEEYSW